MQEVWKEINGYENLYEVSNMGEIRSKRSGIILKQHRSNAPYNRVALYKDRKRREFLVHRLVAEAFVPNPERKETVNHKDFDTFNNKATNLEWSTIQENIKYSVDQGRYKPSKNTVEKRTKTQTEKSRAVLARNVVTGEILKFPYTEITKRYGYNPSCVSLCCRGVRKTHKGYVWSYADKKEGEENS